MNAPAIGQTWACSNRRTPHETVFRILRRRDEDDGWWTQWRFKDARDWQPTEGLVWDDAWTSGDHEMTRVE